MYREEPTADELIAEWQAVDGRRRQAAGPLFRALRQLFRDLAEEAAAMMEAGNYVVPDALPKSAVRQNPDQDPPQQREPLTAETVLSLAFLTNQIRDTFEGTVPDVVRQGFETAVQRLEADTNFNPDDPAVTETVARLNAQASGIAKTTQSKINATIREGIAENESVEEIQGRVTSTLNKMADGDDDPDTDIDQSRAQRIASTTTTSAFEAGQKEAMDRTGVYGRMWLSQRDVHVRPGHLEADGQTVRLGNSFEVGPRLGGPTEELAFPGDPSGAPSNVINCRCTALPIPDAETFEEMQSEEPDLSDLPQLSEDDA